MVKVCDAFKNDWNESIDPKIYTIKREDLSDEIREISINDCYAYNSLIIDVDEQYSEHKERIEQLIEKQKIPEPSWITVNKRSGKFHVVYIFNQRYKKKYHFNQRAYKKINSYFSKILNGDPAYKGLWTHNPFHSGFQLEMLSGNVYANYDLAFYVSEKKYVAKNTVKKFVKKDESLGMDFRNNTIFRRALSFLNQNLDYNKVLEIALNDMAYYNQNSKKEKLRENEIRHIVKSANNYHKKNKNYVYYNVSLDGTISKKSNAFIEKQKERSRLGLIVRRKQAEEAIAKMVELLKEGKHRLEIMKMLNISNGTYYAYRKIIHSFSEGVAVKKFKKKSFLVNLKQIFNSIQFIEYLNYFKELFDLQNVYELICIFRQRDNALFT